MAYTLCPSPVVQWFDSAGTPLSGGLLYTYLPATAIPKTTYTDSTGTVPNMNPVVLDSAGRAQIWLNGSYRMMLTDSTGTVQWVADNVVAGDQIQFATLQNSIDILSALVDNKAGLNSPIFVGTPKAPTANSITDNTQIATTAFVHNVINEQVTSITYVGQISFFAMPSAPAGWLPCAGGAYSRTNYSNLFALIGTTFGNGDGSTTFNVPNLQNRYITGWDTVKTFGGTEKLNATGTTGVENMILYPCIKA